MVANMRIESEELSELRRLEVLYGKTPARNQSRRDMGND